MRGIYTWLVLFGMICGPLRQATAQGDNAAPAPAEAPTVASTETAAPAETVDAADATGEVPPETDTTDVDKLSALQFLSIARRPPIQDSWAKMTGTVSHYEGLVGTTAPIEFRAKFSPNRILAQIIVNDSERYSVSQTFADGLEGTSVITDKAALPGKATLADLGMRPNDLTLSFLYWTLVEELKPERVRGLKCRVFRLKHPTEPESCVVAIATTYFFPMRVSWYDAAGKERNRVLEFTNFKKKGDIWIVNEALLKDAGWKTRVRFDNVTVEAVTPDSTIPADLFKVD